MSTLTQPKGEPITLPPLPSREEVPPWITGTRGNPDLYSALQVRKMLAADRERLAVAAPVAWMDVQAERQRQISAEGWTPEHDDEHGDGSLAVAAACYALGSPHVSDRRQRTYVTLWPWDQSWWKQSPPRRMLVKAAALILAEIERLDRSASKNCVDPMCACRGGPCAECPEGEAIAALATSAPAAWLCFDGKECPSRSDCMEFDFCGRATAPAAAPLGVPAEAGEVARLAARRHEINTHANDLRTYIDSLSGDAFQGAIHSLGALRDIIDELLAVAASSAAEPSGPTTVALRHVFMDESEALEAEAVEYLDALLKMPKKAAARSAIRSAMVSRIEALQELARREFESRVAALPTTLKAAPEAVHPFKPELDAMALRTADMLVPMLQQRIVELEATLAAKHDTAPQAMPVPLTDERLDALWDQALADKNSASSLDAFARLIERDHGIGSHTAPQALKAGDAP